MACPTPDAWLDQAVSHLPILLEDHANCEKKAAGTAMNLLFRYVDRSALQYKLSQLAREELLHYEQVMQLMQQRGLAFSNLPAGRYVAGLRLHVRTSEPWRLVDLLIVGAFVEARSCERFAALAPRVDEELRRFYRFLLKSESRHFEDYIALASEYAPTPIDDRVAFFRERESELIQAPDTLFRFHSGPVSADPVDGAG